MEFRILGSLDALDEHGSVALGGIKPRAVLAYLLLHANEPVSADRLAVALWGEDVPPAATKTVQVHVSRLRKALGDPSLLTTTAAGYRLALGHDDLDATRFARLVEEGRAALAGDDHELASILLHDALALWRGPALADLAFEPFAQTQIAELEELRLGAIEDRIDADLAGGRHGGLVGELLRLVADNPIRERLTAQLMLALYRCGRQGEALDAYVRFRARQASELGLEPSPTLQSLQARILEQSPTLELAIEEAATPRPAERPADAPTETPRAASARGRIVGRRPELDELRAALDDARSGEGSLFVLLGAAGIGKTRLAQAIANEAAARGHDVLWGSAWEGGGAAAYWPWTQVLRQLLDARPQEELIADLGEGAAYVAPIAPEVRRVVGMSGDPLPSLDSEAVRFNAFDNVGSFLRAAAARRPLMLVLDDMHAADVASVRLLEFVARGLHGARILVITTQRTDTNGHDVELSSALADLGRPAHRLTLGGLSRDEVHELAEAQSRRQLPPRLVDRLHAHTEGNPLFVDEVIRLLGAEGALASPRALTSGRLPVPSAVRETIRRRLSPLGAAVIEALTAAAVVGSQFDLDTLAQVVGEQRATVLAQLDDAAGAGIVGELPEPLGRYAFTHAIVREMLYDELGARDRALLHGRVGEAIAAIHGTGADAPLAELAHHFVAAAPAGDAARAASYAARAGERALEQMAYEQAIELFNEALRALQPGDEQASRRGKILLALGQAEVRAGRLDAGRATLLRAVEDARRLGDAELLARAALASAPLGLATGFADEEGLIPIIQEALERLSGEDSALRARLQARLAAALYWSVEAGERMALAEQAIAMARRVGDLSTLAFVLSDAHRATWDADSPERSLPWASEIYAVSERLGNMELALIAHSWRISLLLELGELTIVDREIEIFESTAARLHQQRAQAQGLLHRCARSIIAGRFEQAEQLLGEASAYAALLQQDPFLSMRLGALAFVMREVQDRLEELEPAVRHFADSHPAMPVWQCGLVAVYRQAGREAELRRAYDSIVSAGLDALPRDNLWLPALALLAETTAYLGDRDTAREMRAMLEPYAGRNVVTPDVAFIGPVDRYLALLAITEGDDDAALAWFGSARELADRMGAAPTSARLALDEARWLHEREPQRAATLAGEAAAAADALGLERLAAHARKLAGEAVPPA